MAIDFPNAPTLNQLWPQPAQVGVPVWKWNGAAWVTVGGPGLSTIYVSDTAPTGAAPGSLWWESDIGVLYVNYNDGTSTQWVSVVSGSDPTTYAVRYDTAQTLTATQREQARINIASATIANPAANLIINGDFSISQENGTAQINVPNNALKYAADSWVFNSQQAANTALFTTTVWAQSAAYPGLNSQLGLVAQTAWTPGSASEYTMLMHYIEGQRWSKLGWGLANAMPISIGFWVYASVTGTFGLSIRNGPANRSYVVPITVTAVNVWQYKTVTIPGDTAGGWSIDTSVGAVITLCFGSGSTFTTSNTNSWQAANLLAPTGVTNFFAANSNAIYVTGFSLIAGNCPVPIEQCATIRRSFDDELRLCQRYYWSSNPASPKGVSLGSLVGTALTNAAIVGSFRTIVPMRVVPPIITLWQNGVQNQVRATATGGVTAVSGFSMLSETVHGNAIFSLSGTPLTVGAIYDFDLIRDARM